MIETAPPGFRNRNRATVCRWNRTAGAELPTCLVACDSLSADFAGPIYVGFESDCLQCAANRTQHRRKDFGSILQCGNAVSGNDTGTEQVIDGAKKLGIAHRKAVRDLVADLLLGGTEI
jgi:hypothetical protein